MWVRIPRVPPLFRKAIVCGIVGIAGKLDIKDDKVISCLLALDVLRGEDSTGLGVVKLAKGAEVKVVKALGNPFELMGSKKFESALMGFQRAMIGHNRYATVGGIHLDSAHPFENDGVMGVHNGTLTNKFDLLDHSDFRTDSEALYHNINELGVKEAIGKCRGSWALAWWDKYDESINFLRNAERPLHMCYTEDGKKIYWASEVWMLEVALSRYGIKHQAIGQIRENMHYKITVDCQGNLGQTVLKPIEGATTLAITTYHDRPFFGGTEKKESADTDKGVVSAITTPDKAFLGARSVVVELVGVHRDKNGASYIYLYDNNNPDYEIRLYNTRHYNYEHEVGGWAMVDINSFSTGEGGYYKASPSSVSIIEIGPEVYKDHKGNSLTADEWETRYGTCAFCSSNVSAKESKETILTSSGQCLCPACAKDEAVNCLVSS